MTGAKAHVERPLPVVGRKSPLLTISPALRTALLTAASLLIAFATWQFLSSVLFNPFSWHRIRAIADELAREE